MHESSQVGAARCNVLLAALAWSLLLACGVRQGAQENRSDPEVELEAVAAQATPGESVTAGSSVVERAPRTPPAVRPRERSTTTIAGTLRSRTGQYHPSDVRISFSYNDTSIGGRIKFEQTGSGWIGTFEVEATPLRTYEVRLSKRDPFLIQPENVQVRAGTQDLELICEDDTPVYGVSFRVVNIDGCTPIESATVIVERVVTLHVPKSGGRVSEYRVLEHPKPNSLEYTSFLEGSNYHWVASAPGHHVVVGDETSLLRTTSASSIASQDVLLPSGWGAEFLVEYGTTHTRALPSASIAIDGGDPIAVDARGRLVVNRSEIPTRIEVYCPGYSWNQASQIGLMREIASLQGTMKLRMDRAR